jgi:hypothetical protein
LRADGIEPLSMKKQAVGTVARRRWTYKRLRAAAIRPSDSVTCVLVSTVHEYFGLEFVEQGRDHLASISHLRELVECP